MSAPRQSPRSNRVDWAIAAIARPLLMVLVGGFVVVLLLAVVWLFFSPFRPVPDERPELRQALAAAVSEAGDGGVVDLGAVANFDWDRMYAFGAYTPDSAVSETLGFEWGTGDDLRLPNDGFVLLIFAEDQAVTGWAVLNDYQWTGPVVQVDEQSLRRPIPREVASFKATLQPYQTEGGSPIYSVTQVGS